jgi:DNA end-binding protein Ku
MGVSWKGSISFGLVYIPIHLYVAADENNVSFNQLHDKCKHRINYKKVCPICNEEVKQENIVKGYNYEDDKYVIFNEDDFEKIKTAKDKSINIIQFVNLSEIDTIFYEKSYYVVPDGGEKAFELLKKAMSETNKVGVAKAVLGTKESLIALRMSGNNMILNTMFFIDEIKNVQTPYMNIELNQSEIDLAKQLISNMTSAFKPEQFHDDYIEKLKSAITQKIEGNEITETQEPQTNVINLMDALQASLKATDRQIS